MESLLEPWTVSDECGALEVHRNSLLEFTGHNVRKDLKFAMAVCIKPGMRLNTVLVHHTKGSELRVGLIIVPAKLTQIRFG